MTRAVLGFRVKSGYAVAVVLTGSRSVPAIAARLEVALSDPEVPESRQPFHHGFYTHETDARALARRVRVVERCARASVDALLADGAAGNCRRASLVVGSLIDPDSVGNPHIRAHACEGRLFRTVLQSALERHGVRCEVFVHKQLAQHASVHLNRRSADVARVVGRFGKVIGGPWRADEKAASTAAWLLLK